MRRYTIGGQDYEASELYQVEVEQSVQNSACYIYEIKRKADNVIIDKVINKLEEVEMRTA